jgi:ribosomal 50S subunit-recycling heat shock protein
MSQTPPLLGHANLPGMTERLRLDKWLWAARFYKTRSLAADDIDKGRIKVAHPHAPCKYWH